MVLSDLQKYILIFLVVLVIIGIIILIIYLRRKSGTTISNEQYNKEQQKPERQLKPILLSKPVDINLSTYDTQNIYSQEFYRNLSTEYSKSLEKKPMLRTLPECCININNYVNYHLETVKETINYILKRNIYVKIEKQISTQTQSQKILLLAKAITINTINFTKFYLCRSTDVELEADVKIDIHDIDFFLPLNNRLKLNTLSISSKCRLLFKNFEITDITLSDTVFSSNDLDLSDKQKSYLYMLNTIYNLYLVDMLTNYLRDNLYGKINITPLTNIQTDPDVMKAVGNFIKDGFNQSIQSPIIKSYLSKIPINYRREDTGCVGGELPSVGCIGVRWRYDISIDYIKDLTNIELTDVELQGGRWEGNTFLYPVRVKGRLDNASVYIVGGTSITPSFTGSNRRRSEHYAVKGNIDMVCTLVGEYIPDKRKTQFYFNKTRLSNIILNYNIDDVFNRVKDNIVVYATAVDIVGKLTGIFDILKTLIRNKITTIIEDKMREVIREVNVKPLELNVGNISK